MKKRGSLYRDASRKIFRDPVALICFVTLVIYGLIALLTKWGVVLPDVAVVNQANGYQPPDATHWFGTDIFGRDVFSKAVHGIKTSMAVGLVASGLAIPIGVFFGAIAGYFGGVVDEVIVWFYTTVDSIPSILLIIALAYALGPGITNAFIAIGLTSWVTLCRLIRAEFFKYKEREFVIAARAMGSSPFRIIFHHILPNTFHIIIIQFSLNFVYAIKSEVILSYLGLGVTAGQFSWGLMIDDAKLELARGIWWQLAGATLFMFILILAFNLFNDALRAALDPKLSGK